MRPVNGVIAVALIGLAACLDGSTEPSTSEGLTLRIVGPGSSAALDSGYVRVAGPTSKTVKATPGTTVTIDGLAPGSYTVALQGFRGGGVAFFGQTTGVNVVAGQNTTATITFLPFQPAILSIPSYTVDGTFDLVFSSVASAASYIVQADANPSFPSPQETSIAATNTSPQISIPKTGPHHVRVLAVDPFGVRGEPSAASTVTTVTAVTVSPATATIDPGATQAFTAEAKDAQNNTVTGVTFFWASDNQSVALVNPATGVATGVSVGTATISALGLGLPGNAVLTVQVTIGAPAALAFVVQPASGEPLGLIAPTIQVAVKDAAGNTVPGATNTVTIELGANPGGATLSGTASVDAVSGVASFTDLSVNNAANGYTLRATATGLGEGTSASFDVFLDFVSVNGAGAEGQFTCGVTTTGAAYCWGSGFAGQLGNGGTATRNVPVPVSRPAGVTFTAVTAGGAGTSTGHACALTPAGAAYCWGTGANGRLGNGGTANSNVPVAVTMPSGVTFTRLSAGQGHTCALTTAGAGYCWGVGANGRLGAGTADATTPQQVSGGHVFTSVSAGRAHTCGVRASDGRVLCWGSGTSGQRGSGGTIGSIPDATSPELTTNTSSFLSVSAGDLHTCGVRNDGVAFCWGEGTQGRLGNNGTVSVSTPVQVVGGLKFASVSPGGRHTCALSTAGSAFCWGEGIFQQLGNGNEVNSAVPVAVVGGRTYLSLKSGGFTNCPVAQDGVFCWGFGGQGELGDGTNSSSSVPVRVLGTR